MITKGNALRDITEIHLKKINAFSKDVHKNKNIRVNHQTTVHNGKCQEDAFLACQISKE